MVRKVSAIHGAGTFDSAVVIPGDGGQLITLSSGAIGYVDGRSSTTARQTGATRLASALAPPAEPPPPGGAWIRRIIGVVFMVMALLSVPNGIEAINTINQPGASIRVQGSNGQLATGVELAQVTQEFWVLAAVLLGGLFLVGLLLLIWGISAAGRDRRRFVADSAEHNRAMAQWARLYYCAKCDHVFDPAWDGSPIPVGAT